ncbi:MAG: NADH-quinone oxidoreductase subunit H [Thaumarchaeota archaeon]|nr:NADH-quinone oxidoreductase subunit H [Candidatus Calditenuaceae archaeon]MDW8042216.1 complex I subunit 1 family protein [Nitrososphaerota archaeon]
MIEQLAQLLASAPEPIRTLLGWIFSDAFIKAAVFPGALFSTILGMFAVWYERKLLARVMLRVGPLHVGKVSGVLQLIADAVKFLSKERITPSSAIRPLFWTMPSAALLLSLLLFAFLPFGAGWIIYPSEIGLLLFFAVIAVSPIPILLAAYASGSKYPFIGLTRMALQLFGYEIPLFLALAGVVLMAGSFDIQKIVEAQARAPFILPQMIGFVVFFTAALAETERVPFDIPTAEGEIVFGWQTEYSGAHFVVFQLAMYEKILALCVLGSLLYLGGWYGPPLPFVPDTISAPFWVIVKSLVLFTLMVLVRGAYPRLSIDRVLDLGWRYLIPLALLNLLITGVIVYLSGVLA